MTDDLHVLVHSPSAAVLAGMEVALSHREDGSGPELAVARLARPAELGRTGRPVPADAMVLHGADHRRVRRWPRSVRRMVVLAVGDDWCGTYVVDALRMGVRGVVSVDSDLAALARACHRVAAGSAYLSPRLVGALAAHLAGEDESPDVSALSLSAREVQVLRHLAGGRSQADISGLMNITVRTVKHHLGNVYRKLGVHNQQEAVVLAYRRGLVV